MLLTITRLYIRLIMDYRFINGLWLNSKYLYLIIGKISLLLLKFKWVEIKIHQILLIHYSRLICHIIKIEVMLISVGWINIVIVLVYITIPLCILILCWNLGFELLSLILYEINYHQTIRICISESDKFSLSSESAPKTVLPALPAPYAEAANNSTPSTPKPSNASATQISQ